MYELGRVFATRTTCYTRYGAFAAEEMLAAELCRPLEAFKERQGQTKFVVWLERCTISSRRLPDIPVPAVTHVPPHLSFSAIFSRPPLDRSLTGRLIFLLSEQLSQSTLRVGCHPAYIKQAEQKYDLAAFQTINLPCKRCCER